VFLECGRKQGSAEHSRHQRIRNQRNQRAAAQHEQQSEIAKQQKVQHHLGADHGGV
jgi:hypothetical protein